jgi:hypothetical protein
MKEFTGDEIDLIREALLNKSQDMWNYVDRNSRKDSGVPIKTLRRVMDELKIVDSSLRKTMSALMIRRSNVEECIDRLDDDKIPCPLVGKEDGDDREFIRWIHDRLEYVYKEDTGHKYMTRLSKMSEVK